MKVIVDGHTFTCDSVMASSQSVHINFAARLDGTVPKSLLIPIYEHVEVIR